MDEVSADGDASADASAEVVTATETEMRPAVGRRGQGGWRGRLAAQALLTLSALLVIASVTASLAASDWKSFNPMDGLSAIHQSPLDPQSFGDTGSIPQPPYVPDSGAVAAISGQTYKPTAKRASAPATVIAHGVAPASWTGSWSGGAGQGCPNGSAPRPSGNIIYDAANYGVTHTNMVALTFDDGPSPSSSPAILSFLERSHTPATFFVLGQYAHAYPWLIQREAADGFAIGVHTWSHPDMRLLSVSARAYQFGATIQQLHADLGPNACMWLWRPPYGAVNSSIVAQAGAFGLTTIYWNVDPQDWARPGTMVIVQRVLSQVRPGSIILMHDGPAAREETAAALPYILAGLQARGLVPVTLPTLLDSASAPTAPAPTVTATTLPTATATTSPTATATAAPIDTATPTATIAPTPTATIAPTPTATNAPTPTATAMRAITGPVMAALALSPRSDSLSDTSVALGLWLWENVLPRGYNGA